MAIARDLVAEFGYFLIRIPLQLPQFSDSLEQVNFLKERYLLTMVEQLEALEAKNPIRRLPLSDEPQKQFALDVAHCEDILVWCGAIAQWIGQHCGEKVSLFQLLTIPLVEVWLGLLHSSTPYQ